MQLQLPSELLNETFEYLCDDHATLHSCIRVNRAWCQLAVSVLWRYPVSKDFMNIKAVATYVACLNHAEREDLRTAANVYIPVPERRPVFDYMSFLRILDGQCVHEMSYQVVYAWGADPHSADDDYTQRTEAACRVLVRTLLAHGTHLRKLGLRGSSVYRHVAENAGAIRKLQIRVASLCITDYEDMTESELRSCVRRILAALPNIREVEIYSHRGRFPLWEHMPRGLRRLRCIVFSLCTFWAIEAAERLPHLSELWVKFWQSDFPAEEALQTGLALVAEWVFGWEDDYIVARRTVERTGSSSRRSLGWRSLAPEIQRSSEPETRILRAIGPTFDWRV